MNKDKILRFIYIGVFCIALIFALIYFLKYSPKKATAENPNVIIISVDTLRADHLGTYGYMRDTSPNIDKFAKENLTFSNAFTPASCTVPSYASLFTGLYPTNHQVFENKLDSKYPTLADKLKKDGYNTAGFVSSTILNDNFNNLGRGFKTYNEANEKDVKDSPNDSYILDLPENDPKIPNVVQRAKRTTEEADAWLEKNSSSQFFMFVHYFDPHAPYGSPEPFKDKYARDLPANSLEDVKLQNIAINQNMTSSDLEYLKAKYDEDIAYTDYYIGELLKKVGDLKLNDNTMIIITADHGESFENNYQNHCYRVYDSVVKIPLIIHDPQQSAPKKVQTQVSLIDIYPTILERLKMNNDAKTDGQDIYKYLSEDSNQREPLYAMSMPIPSYFVQATAKKFKFIGQLFVSISQNERLIYNENSGKKDFYNIKNDPGQNIALALNAEANNLFEKMMLWLSSANGSGINKIFQKNKDLYEQMKSLGYL